VIGSSRVEATRADGVQAQASLREQRQLLRIGGLSDAAIEGLKSAEGMNPSLVVAAKRGGRVLSLDVRAGDRVEIGAPLAAVAALDELWVDLQATREQAGQLAVGDQAQLADCAARGRVIAAGVQLDATSQTTSARVRFEGAGACVSPNQYVQVTVSAAQPPAGLLSVPSSALFHYAGHDAVFIEQGEAFRVVDVKVERNQGNRAWLRADALRDAKVVTAGVAALKGRWQGLGVAAGVKGTD
jgi:multidrug efflux pump subunit AcrA (membrane-fusion protein)